MDMMDICCKLNEKPPNLTKDLPYNIIQLFIQVIGNEGCNDLSCVLVPGIA